MKTLLLPINDESLALAARLIREGEVVAFPTETVYGLGADALNEDAVRKIFAAKGRPSDNPLIVHVADKEALSPLCREINDRAQKLIDAFMPGPLTVVLPKDPKIPDCVTGGIDTVGLRLPVHEGARAFLRACGCPIAAPSANSSGKPSPTCAAHVLDDLDGKIPLILDGGASDGGVESTVISLAGEEPLLLRPGLVTKEMLESVLGPVRVHPAVLHAGQVDRAASPGMKYKHYSPAARVLITEGSMESACRLYDLCVQLGRRPLLLRSGEERVFAQDRAFRALTEHRDPVFAARHLFDELRRCDEENFDTVLVMPLSTDGAGLSVMNRLLRAAAFTVLTEEEIGRMTKETLKNRLTT